MATPSFTELNERLGFVLDPDTGERIGAGHLKIAPASITLDLPVDAGVLKALKLDSFPFSPQTPKRLVFSDRHGMVALGGCNIRTYNLGGATGWTRLFVDYAAEIENESQDYWSVTGLRSEVAGLPRWTGLSSVQTSSTKNDMGLISGITVSAQSGEAIHVGSQFGLSLYPYFSLNGSFENGEHILTEKVFVQTSVKDPIPWDHHLDVHQAIQDLLTIAYWRPCEMNISLVSNNKYPLTMPRSDEPLGELWRPAKSVRGGRAPGGARAVLPSGVFPLFDLDKLGVGNLLRWITEHRQWMRVIGPLVSSKYQRGTVEVKLIQTAISIEAIGYLIALRQGEITEGKSLSFPKYLKLIRQTLDCSIDPVLAGSPDNGIPKFKNYDEWADAFNYVYKQSKHADHELPDGVRASILRDSGALLVRLWLAREFGVDRDTLDLNAQYER
ncbi:hypothetical protein [Rhodococcus pyridinivorans]|uniref:ApeA N-terminal domain 1-containing protein n=1 Tax=Rhodococcus pyridinivorans TaxID=103816 RepID=UPI00110E3935|nr:hypothetical protein [Rhodococcus pyridinivorans]